ncbi:MAG: hypothetical protein ACP6IS_10925 [Candidatus Asgardarchaeia archaeon]
MSKELTLLQNIYSEIKELKRKIDAVDEKLLDIKILLLKEEEISEKEKEEIRKLLEEPEENYVTLDDFKRKQNI